MGGWGWRWGEIGVIVGSGGGLNRGTLLFLLVNMGGGVKGVK